MGLSNAERQRRYIQRLKAQAARASHARIDDREVTALRQQLEQANKRIAELAVALANKERLETKAEKPTSDEARDREIKSLKTRNRNLRAELQITTTISPSAVACPLPTPARLRKDCSPHRARTIASPASRPSTYSAATSARRASPRACTFPLDRSPTAA
jgi:TolA-binding protein